MSRSAPNALPGWKSLGLLPESVALPPLPAAVEAWDSLTPRQQQVESRKMEIYAGMVENLDYNTGRILQHLKDIGEYENTFIFFISDNGADAVDVSSAPVFETWIPKYDNSLDAMGSADSFVSLGPGWAHAVTAPFRLWKTFVTEGGIRVPALMNFPGLEHRPGLVDSVVTVMDLAPTLLELAQVQHPGAAYRDRRIELLGGSSILPLFDDPGFRIHEDSEYLMFELLGTPVRPQRGIEAGAYSRAAREAINGNCMTS